MSSLPEEFVLTSDEEARRLWSAALEAKTRAGDDIVAVCQVLDLGLRAAEIVVVQKLVSVREDFPATIAAQLAVPDPELDVDRDAVGTHRSLHFTELVDLLSEESLDCASPGLHRGWEDRRFSCRRSRKTAQKAVGLTLDAAQQGRLLHLSAYRNRIFRDPPPVRIRPQQIIDGLEDLGRLVQHCLTD